MIESPNSRRVRQRSQPRPGLSGQLTVTMVGSDGSLGNWIKTTSSFGIPISGWSFKGLSPADQCRRSERLGGATAARFWLKMEWVDYYYYYFRFVRLLAL